MKPKYLKINAHDYCEGYLKDFKIDIETGEVCSGTYIDYDSPKYGDPYEYNINDVDAFPEHITCSPSDEEFFDLLDEHNNIIGSVHYILPDLIQLFCEHIYEHTFDFEFEKKSGKLFVKMFDKNIEELIRKNDWTAIKCE